LSRNGPPTPASVDLAYKAVTVPHANADLKLLVPPLLPRIVGVELSMRKLETRLVSRDGSAEPAVGLARELDVYGEPPRVPVHRDVATGEVGEARAAAALEQTVVCQNPLAPT
jgi:hypothetical protein